MLGAKPQVFVAVYQDSSQAIEGLWVADMALAATLGAVLTLIPPAVAQEASRKGQLSPELLEGAQEIANITANSFHDKRVRLASFLAPGALLPAGPAALLASPVRRLDVKLEVAGYPGGRLLMIGP